MSTAPTMMTTTNDDSPAPASSNGRNSPAGLALHLVFAVVLAVVLFCIQVLLQGQATRFIEASWAQKPDLLPLAQVVALLDLKSLVLVALPVMLLGFIAAWLMARWWLGPSRALGRTLALVWVVVSALCWLALFMTLSGNDPSKWSSSILTQPAFWYPLVGTAIAMYAGAAIRSGQARSVDD